MAYTGTGFRPTRWQQRWEGGVDVLVLTGALTVLGTTGNILNLDPSGASRNVDLPAEESSNGLMFWITNAGAVPGEDLVVRSDAPATITTLEPGESAMLACDGTQWVALMQTTSQEVVELTAAAPVVAILRVTTADLTAAAVAQVIAFAAPIPAKAVILARGFDLVTVFAGGGSASAVVDFGDDANDDGWFDGEDVFTGAGLGPKVVPGTAGAFIVAEAADMGVAARTPQIEITADIDVNLLTTGDLTAWVMYVATPLGAAVPG